MNTRQKIRSILSQKKCERKKAQTRAEQSKMNLKSHCKTQATHTTFRDRRIRSRICRINRYCATQDLWKTNSTQDRRHVLKIPGVIETFGEPTASLVIMATLRLARSLFSLLRAGVPIEASRPCVTTWRQSSSTSRETQPDDVVGRDFGFDLQPLQFASLQLGNGLALLTLMCAIETKPSCRHWGCV